MTAAVPADALSDSPPAKASGLATPTWLPRRITLPTLATIAAVVVIVYFAKAIVLPLAIATLISFALSPLATQLRRWGVPNLPGVLAVVFLAFVVIGLFLLVVGTQLTSLAQNLPTFQANIIEKVETLQQAGSENSLLGRLGEMITTINTEIGGGSRAVPDGVATTDVTIAQPVPVQMVDYKSPVAVLRDVLLPLLVPIATVGLVLVVVVFMLLERDELRDRFIRLVGSSDLHRTTQVLTEAGQRVAQYLLVQLLVNVIYAVPIGVGLYFIGVPNAILWGLLTMVLRFVPYIGSVLAAAFPLFLAFAVSPDWSAILWTLALFGVVELITSNIIEPWLYGARTGVSPLAIIVSAMFWTWLWGPLGLVVSTPLTVCLVVLGRHLPQFELFDILLGDQPVLAPHSRLYQRLLVGDVMEASVLAEESLETLYLAEYYSEIGIPALIIAQQDQARGVLRPEQHDSLVVSVRQMVADLAEVATDELDLASTEDGDADADNRPRVDAPVRVLCIGGRSDLDDLAAAMLAQSLTTTGAVTTVQPHTDLARRQIATFDSANLDCVVINFLDAAPSRASFLHIRRIKRALPGLRVGVVVWQQPPRKGQDITLVDLGAMPMMPVVSAETLQQARDIGADFAVTSVEAVRKEANAVGPAKPLDDAGLRMLRPPRSAVA